MDIMNTFNDTPLHYAAINGHKNVAELLIKNGAKVDIRNHANLTPRQLAAENGHNDVAKLFIGKRNQINIEELLE
ncbi:putative ankyrin repeat protein RF_1087 [Sitodiplosis mosellana]|uniref:putative ankyrin repeat protein RF_1087 n=1 Tax=Sitodiplosis mosellana TaxID=263140 RepID=UPI0024450767|nr:putative ankyrin repeat protein RF_1087 [Sitodiplosis mosellana]